MMHNAKGHVDMSRITPKQAGRIVEGGFRYAYLRYGLPYSIGSIIVVAIARAVLVPAQQGIVLWFFLYLIAGTVITAPLLASWVLQEARKRIK
jgi:hypothetical protein